MEESSVHFSHIFAVFLLVFLNGFFVAVEFALVRAHPTKLRSPDYKGKFGVGTSLKLIEELDLSLSATQLGITVASLLLGWWGEETFAHLFMNVFASFGDRAAFLLSHAAATILALIVVTFLHVVLGELAAKSLAIRQPEACLRYMAAPMLFFTRVFRPIIFTLNGAANLFLRLFGVKSVAESERVHSIAELAMIVSHSSERGVLDKEEEEMLHGVFNFSETVAREVMTPRPDLVTVPSDASLEDVIDILSESGLSRLPVVNESVDDVVGVLLIRDLLPYLHHYHQPTAPKDFAVTKIMREPYFVPGTKPIDDLLNEFKRRKIHLAIVLDEHGGVDGLVTLEDLIEEIVGDIFDESDIAERDIVVQENGDIVVDGGVLVADLNDRFVMNIPEGDYDTIAGYVLTLLGRLPKPGDTIVVDAAGAVMIASEPVANGSEGSAKSNGHSHDEATKTEEKERRARLSITVERVKGRRIEFVRIKRFSATETDETEGSAIASEERGIAQSEEA